MSNDHCMHPHAPRPALLISACLTGQPVRYDGAARPLSGVTELSRHYRIIPVCPECMGGLPVPRPAAEIARDSGAEVLQGCSRVRTADGEDVTAAFVDGARQVLAIAQREQAAVAILKANSPSCGNRQHYDGTFTGTLRPGQGVTAAALGAAGIRVLNENELDQL